MIITIVVFIRRCELYLSYFAFFIMGFHDHYSIVVFIRRVHYSCQLYFSYRRYRLRFLFSVWNTTNLVVLLFFYGHGLVR